jgi:hypothetical protein
MGFALHYKAKGDTDMEPIIRAAVAKWQATPKTPLPAPVIDA